MSCEGCPYEGQKQVKFMGKKGGIMFVGEAPHTEEEREGKPFVGKSGKVLRRAISVAGLQEYPIFIANALRCKIDNKETKMVNIGLKCCREYLIKAIEIVKPKIIVLLGGIAMKQIMKMDKPMTHRGRWYFSQEFKVPIYCTVHPSYCMRSATREYPNKAYELMSPRERLIFDDLKKLKKICDNNFQDIDIDTDNYKPMTIDDAKDMLKHRYIAVDIETNGLGLGNERIVLSVSFTWKKGMSRVVLLKRFKDHTKSKVTVIPNIEIRKAIEKVLYSDKYVKIVANRPFDENMWNRRVNGNCRWKGKIHDVLVLAHLINENLPTGYNLESVVNHYTDLDNIKDVAEGERENLENVDKDLLVRYNGVDTDATFRAYLTLAKKIKEDKDLLNYYRHFMLPVLDMFSEISYYGFEMSIEKVKASEEALRAVAQKIHTELVKELPEILKQKHTKIKKGEEVGLKFSRSALIRDYLFESSFGLRLTPVKFTNKTKLPATDEGHLKEFDDIPFVSKLLRWKKAEKILTTYYKQIYNAINKDGRIYPNTLFINTVTGRTVVLNPTIQTIPQRSEFAPFIKSLFEAPEGWKLCARDLAQSELRIIGWLANDRNILLALKNGIDLHTKTASIVNKCSIKDVVKDMRQKAKPINFGFVYGMQAKSFVRYAKEEYGQIFTIEEATAIREAFFSRPNGYYKLPEYHARMIGIARKYGYVKSPLGRKRRLPAINSDDFMERSDAERQAINFPVQSFSSDLALISMMLFWQKIKQMGMRDYIKPLWFIHDAIMYIAQDRFVEQTHMLLKRIISIETPAYIKKHWGFEIGYPVESDGKVGQNWAEMEEVE